MASESEAHAIATPVTLQELCRKLDTMEQQHAEAERSSTDFHGVAESRRAAITQQIEALTLELREIDTLTAVHVDAQQARVAAKRQLVFDVTAAKQAAA